jgi:hypothetical protein
MENISVFALRTLLPGKPDKSIPVVPTISMELHLMMTKEEIHSWIAWTSENLRSDESIPLIGNSELNPPWLEGIWETFEYSNPSERSVMREEFEKLLVLNPGDIAVRFPILDFYYNLGRCYSTQKEEFVSETRSAFQQDMAYLVKVETLDSYANWRALRWEVVNGCVVGAWDFSDRAFGKAFQLQVFDRGTLQALRGQYNFLVSFRSEVGEEISAFFHKVLGKAISVEPDIWDLRPANESAANAGAMPARIPS